MSTERLTIPDTDQGGHLDATPNGGQRTGQHLQLLLTQDNGKGLGMDLDRADVLALHAYLGDYLDATTGPERPELPDATADGYGWPTSAMAHESVATEAHAAVYGDRQDDYGHPREDFTRTAILWTGLLQHKLQDGEYIEAEDIARCQIGVKLARDVHSPKRDNRVDMAGYAITLDRLETGR